MRIGTSEHSRLHNVWPPIDPEHAEEPVRNASEQTKRKLQQRECTRLTHLAVLSRNGMVQEYLE